MLSARSTHLAATHFTTSSSIENTYIDVQWVRFPAQYYKACQFVWGLVVIGAQVPTQKYEVFTLQFWPLHRHKQLSSYSVFLDLSEHPHRIKQEKCICGILCAVALITAVFSIFMLLVVTLNAPLPFAASFWTLDCENPSATQMPNDQIVRVDNITICGVFSDKNLHFYFEHYWVIR